MNFRISLRCAYIVLTLGIVLAVLGQPAQAATYTWNATNGQGQWDTSSNWTGTPTPTWTTPGNTATAIFNTSGASVTVNNPVYAGCIKLLQSGTISGGAITLPSVAGTASSTLVNNASGVTTISSSMTVGGGYWLGNGSGTLNIAGAISTAGTNFFLANGNYSLSSGGTINVASGAAVLDFNTSASPNTTNFTQTAGLFSVSRTNSTNVFYLSQYGSTTYNITGGALKVSGSATGTGVMYFNYSSAPAGSPASSGTLTINGPSALVATPQMSLVYSTAVTTGSGVVNLQNGTLQTDYLFTGNPANSVFNFSGGTLQPRDAGNGVNYGWGSSAGTANISVTLSTGNPVISSNDANGTARTVPIYANLLGSGTLTTIGNGTLILAGTGNTFSGNTIIAGGTLLLAQSAAIGSSTLDYNSYGGTLSFGSLINAKFAGLMGGQGLTLNGSAGDVALTVGGNNASTTYSGNLSDTFGGGSLTKVGTGSLTLAGGNTYGGSTTISAGTLAVNGSIASNTISVGSVTTLAGSGLIGGNSSTTTLTGNATVNLTGGTIGGALNATGGNWLGNGTVAGLVTASSNTFTVASGGTLNAAGGFNLTGGTLTGQGTISGGATTLYSGALIAPGSNANNGSIGTLALANFTLGGGTLNFDLSNTTAAGGVVNDLIQAGNLSLGSGFTMLNLNRTSGSLAVGSPYTLITYSGVLDTSGGGSIILSPASAALFGGRQFPVISNGSGSSSAVTLTINGVAANLTWIGTNSTTWVENANTPNVLSWASSGSPAGDYFTAGDNVTFDNSALVTTVTLSGTVSPGSITVAGTNNFTFTGGGLIGGATGLTVKGPGALTIANLGGNSYSGATLVQGGTLVLEIDNALPQGGALTMGSSTSNATLDLAGYSQEIGSLAVASGASAAGQIISNSSTNSQATLTYTGSGGSTFGGTIKDAINGGNQRVFLTMNNGLLNLTGSNTFTGTTTINAGTLQLGSGVPGQDGSIGSSGAIYNYGSLVFNNVGPSALANQINGSGALVQNGGGALTLTGYNSVSALTFNGSGAIVGGTINLSAGTPAAPSLVNNAAGVTTVSSAMTLAGPGYWTGNSGGTLAIGGQISQFFGTNFNLASGNYTLASGGAIDVPGGAVILNSASGSTTNFTQTGGLFSVTRSTANVFYLCQGKSSTTNYTITDGALTVTGSAAGSGALVLAYYNNVNGETATLNINGPTAVVTTPELAIGWAGDTLGQGVLNLQNGTLQVDHLYTQLASISTFNFSGGTLQPVDSAVAGLGWGSATGANNTTITLSTANPVISSNDASGNPQTVPIYANLVGSGTLTTTGNGKLILAGTGTTFSGWTNVTSGSLYVTGSLSASGSFSVASGATFGGSGSAGQVNVAAGGSLEAGYNGSGSLKLAGLALNGDATINAFDVGSLAGPAAISVSGSNAFNMGSSTATFYIQGTLQPTGTVHLIQYSGAIQGAGYGFTVGTTPASTRPIVSSLVNNAGSNGGNVDWIYAVDYPYWTGAGDQNWNTSSANNWTLALSGGSTTFLSGDNVIFDDRASSSMPTVKIDAADVTPATVTFSNGTAAYTLAGGYGITGSASLTVNGPGAVTLATSNTYTGGTTLNNGTVRIGIDTTKTGGIITNGPLGTGPLTLNGGTLTSDSATPRTIYNPVFFNGNVTLGDSTNNGNLLFSTGGTLTGSPQLTINTGNQVTYNGVLSGSGSPTITGNGLFKVVSIQSYTGATTINGGTMQVGIGTTLLTVPSVKFNLGPAGTLEYYTNWASATGLPWYKLNGSGTFVFQGVNDNASNKGASSDTMNSATDEVPASFTGTIIADDAMIDPYGATNGFGGAQNLIVRNGGQLRLAIGPGNYGVGTTLHLSGPGWYTSSGGNVGVLQFTFASTWAGNVALDGDVRIGAALASSPSNNSGTITGAISGSHTLEVGGGNVVYGTVTLAPAGTNSFTALKVSGGSGGTAATVSAGSAGAFPTLSPAVLTMNGGNLKLNGFSFSFADLTGTSGTIQNGSSTTAATITDIDNMVSTTYSGKIVNGGTAPLAFTKLGTGTLTLSGTNTYTGGTTVSGGELILGNNGAIADGTSLTVGDPAAFEAPVVPSPSVAAGSGLSAPAAVAPVPEPGTLALLAGMAVAGWSVWRRKAGPFCRKGPMCSP